MTVLPVSHAIQNNTGSLPLPLPEVERYSDLVEDVFLSRVAVDRAQDLLKGIYGQPSGIRAAVASIQGIHCPATDPEAPGIFFAVVTAP